MGSLPHALLVEANVKAPAQKRVRKTVMRLELQRVNVLGKLQFEGKPLRELLIEAKSASLMERWLGEAEGDGRPHGRSTLLPCPSRSRWPRKARTRRAQLRHRIRSPAAVLRPKSVQSSTASLSGVARCWHSNAYFSLFSSLFSFASINTRAELSAPAAIQPGCFPEACV
jgi:hypothetical protein